MLVLACRIRTERARAFGEGFGRRTFPILEFQVADYPDETCGGQLRSRLIKFAV